MKQVARNLSTVLRRPALGLEYMGWSLQSLLRRGGPIRRIQQVVLGGFNGFSEYHSVLRGVSDAENAFMQSWPLGPGAIIDVGANLGIFCLLMSNRLRDRTIYAFEPSPTTFAALRGNILRNKADKISAHQMAVADRDGLVSFAARENARANSSIQAENDDDMAHPAISVPCTTLDSFMASAAPNGIALLKVDVEGYESAVFRGATQTFSTYRPGVVYFEVCPLLAREAGFDPTDAARFLVNRGYRLHRLAADGALVPVDADSALQVTIENWIGIDVQ